MPRPEGPYPELEQRRPRNIVRGTNRRLTPLQASVRYAFGKFSTPKGVAGQRIRKGPGIFVANAKIDPSKVQDRRGQRVRVPRIIQSILVGSQKATGNRLSQKRSRRPRGA